MNILYISSPITSSFGGGERVIETLIDGLPEDQHSFIGSSRALYDLFRGKGRPAVLAAAGTEPVNLAGLLLFPLSLLQGIGQLVRYRHLYRQADLIVSPTSFTEVFFTVPWLRLLWKKPVVLILQSSRAPKAIVRTPLRSLFNRIQRGCAMVVVSEAQRQLLLQQGLPVREARLIPNAVPVSPFAPRVGEARPGQIAIGFLGRLHQEKGVDLLLEAASRLRLPDGLEQVVVRIGGDGPERERLQELTKTLPFASGVTLKWQGFVQESQSFYRDIDLLVLPSRRESFGLVMLEAWERGTPVLSSSIPALAALKQAEGLPAEERQLVFAPEDSAELARQLARFLEKRGTYAEAAYQRSLHSFVEQNFGVDRMIGQYRSLFSQHLTRS